MQVALLPHSNKVLGLNPSSADGLPVGTFMFSSAWVLSGFSGLGVGVGVKGCLSLSALPQAVACL